MFVSMGSNCTDLMTSTIRSISYAIFTLIHKLARLIIVVMNINNCVYTNRSVMFLS